MTEPWYRAFFGRDFWRLAAGEYTEERTTQEADYLVDVLSRHAPGRRVVDLGSGLGRHARRLAGAGFAVVGVDQSAEAVAQARAAEPRARWVRHDLLGAEPLPFGEVDAAVCVQSFGWGSDAAQLRLLRRVRRHLAPGGLLVLDVSSASAILRHFAAEHVEPVEGGQVRLRRSYDVASGCNLGSIETALDGEATRRQQHRIRLYAVHEALALVRAAGYEVLRCDADFAAGRAPDMDSRYVQVLARPAVTAPQGLAVAFHARPPQVPLDLRAAPDEGGFLDVDVAGVWAAWVREQPDLGHTEAAAYRFDDPYGGRDLAPVLGRRHGCTLDHASVTAGPGITGLLATLAGLAGGGVVLADRYAHPDLPAWARGHGARVVHADLAGAGVEDVLRLAGEGCDVLLLERPALLGAPRPLAQLRALAAGLAATGCTVVVDEAYWNYLDPRESAVRLASEVANLVVLGGISKAYRMGGLRVGWAVASPPVAAAVRELVAPLGCASASLAFTRHLLARPDPLGGLRRRVAACRPVLADRLASHGFEVLPGDPGLPWVTVDAAAGAGERLRAAGVAAKRIVPGAPAAGPGPEGQHPDGPEPGVLRLAVPLSDERLALLDRCLPVGADASSAS